MEICIQVELRKQKELKNVEKRKFVKMSIFKGSRIFYIKFKQI